MHQNKGQQGFPLLFRPSQIDCLKNRSFRRLRKCPEYKYVGISFPRLYHITVSWNDIWPGLVWQKSWRLWGVACLSSTVAPFIHGWELNLDVNSTQAWLVTGQFGHLVITCNWKKALGFQGLPEAQAWLKEQRLLEYRSFERAEGW